MHLRAIAAMMMFPTRDGHRKERGVGLRVAARNDNGNDRLPSIRRGGNPLAYS